MKPKYTRLQGPAMYTAVPVVSIYLQETKDTRGTITRLLEWEKETQTFPARSLTCGGGAYVALWYPDDAERVKAWLQEQGATQVDAMPS